VVVSGHDFKFIDAYVSHLKRDGVEVLRDAWEWGAAQDLERSVRMRDTATVIVCEWGLANAVWYSKNVRPGQRLFVRIHAQEVRQRAQRFGREIDISAVEKAIFVSTDIRDKALELWGWPIEKTVVIPNYVLDAEFGFHPRRKRDGITLGILGIVPQLKRFDRAIDLLEALVGAGKEATLRIKGHRPEDLSFMNVPSREQELAFYRTQYERIAANPKLAGRVVFEPWGNDVAKWYQTVDVILSCSETESFHYALADGVLSGCFPVVWPWLGAERTYDPAWVVRDLEQAVQRLEAFDVMDEQEREQVARNDRALIVERYGASRVFAALDALLIPANERLRQPEV
jgi:glycosyltransferase involved in cell wall biosynthesis